MMRLLLPLIFVSILLVTAGKCPFHDILSDLGLYTTSDELVNIDNHENYLRQLSIEAKKPPVRKPSPRPTRVPAPMPTARPMFRPTPQPTAMPSDVTYLPSAVCANTVSGTLNDLTICDVVSSIENDLDSILNTFSLMQKSKFFGSVIRLAFHDAAEVLVFDSSDRYGPDGCLSRSQDNIGLIESSKLTSTVIEPMWQRHCSTGISRADFWVLLAKLVVEKSALLGSAVVTVPFYYGRKDNLECDGGKGRLPSATVSRVVDTNSFFASHMNLSSVEVITLLGAHSVGHVSPSQSGFGIVNNQLNTSSYLSNAFDGTPHILDNKYYITLVNSRWDLDNAVSNSHLQDYIERRKFQVMLNIDMSLAWSIENSDKSLKNFCGGPTTTYPTMKPTTKPSKSPTLRPTSSSSSLCTRESSTLETIDTYVRSNTAFVNAFATAMSKMSNSGYSYDTVTGKLGKLSKMTC